MALLRSTRSVRLSLSPAAGAAVCRRCCWPLLLSPAVALPRRARRERWRQARRSALPRSPLLRLLDVRNDGAADLFGLVGFKFPQHGVVAGLVAGVDDEALAELHFPVQAVDAVFGVRQG